MQLKHNRQQQVKSRNIKRTGKSAGTSDLSKLKVEEITISHFKNFCKRQFVPRKPPTLLFADCVINSSVAVMDIHGKSRRISRIVPIDLGLTMMNRRKSPTKKS
jgi:hypothetical protein